MGFGIRGVDMNKKGQSEVIKALLLVGIMVGVVFSYMETSSNLSTSYEEQIVTKTFKSIADYIVNTISHNEVSLGINPQYSEVTDYVILSLDIPKKVGGRSYTVEGIGDQIKIYANDDHSLCVLYPKEGVKTFNFDGKFSSLSEKCYVGLGSPSGQTKAHFFSTDKLFDGKVTPETGGKSTQFKYSIIYMDKDNNPPEDLKVYIDDESYDMSIDEDAPSYLQDGDYINGEQYKFEKILSLGTHDYYFECKEDRFPRSGSIYGPLQPLYISVTANPVSVSVGGVSTIKVRVEDKNKENVDTDVTFKTTLGSFLVEENVGNEYTMETTNGEATIFLESESIGTATVTVESKEYNIKASTTVDFVSDIAILSINTIETDPTIVHRGDTGIVVTMSVDNLGKTQANISSTGLRFNGSTVGYSVTPSAGNPTTIPELSRATFTFSVDVLPTASPGMVIIDGIIEGTDINGDPISDDSAQNVDSWKVEVLTYVSSYNSIIGTVLNFDNAKLDNESYATFKEDNKFIFPENRSFDSSFDGWTSSIGGNDPDYMSIGYEGGYGNPAGSIYVRCSHGWFVSARSGTGTWETTFSYEGDEPSSATLSLDYKVRNYSRADSLNRFTIKIKKPGGNEIIVYGPQDLTGETSWINVNTSIATSVFDQIGTYTLTIFTELSVRGTLFSSADVWIHYDNIKIELNVPDQMNIKTTTSSVPPSSNQVLEIKYKVLNDTYDVFIWNGSAWNNIGTLDSTTETTFASPLTSAQYNGGNVIVRFKDKTSLQGELHAYFIRVKSY